MSYISTIFGCYRLSIPFSDYNENDILAATFQDRYKKLRKSKDNRRTYSYGAGGNETCQNISNTERISPPNRKYKKILIELSGTFRDYIRSNNGSFDVYPAPFAATLKKDNKTIV